MLWMLLAMVAHAETDKELASRIGERAAELSHKAGRCSAALEAHSIVENAAKEHGVTLSGAELPSELESWRVLVSSTGGLAYEACRDNLSTLHAATDEQRIADQRIIAAYRSGDLVAATQLSMAARQLTLAKLAALEAESRRLATRVQTD